MRKNRAVGAAALLLRALPALALAACSGTYQAPAATGVTPNPAAPLPSISIGSTQALESSPQLAFPITLSSASSQPVSFTVQTTDGTAIVGKDYVATRYRIDIAPGQTTAQAYVPIIDDSAMEGDETLTLSLVEVQGATPLVSAAQGVIQDDDAPPVVSVLNASAPEGNPGHSGTLVFRVQLSRAAADPVSLHYATADGTATAGSDYVATQGTLTLPAGSREGSVTVALIGDETVEPDETLKLNLDAVQGATLSPDAGSATGTIQNDDSARTFAVDDAAASESAGPLVFTVHLNQVSAVDRQVRYATVDGTAKAGQDYTATQGTLTVAAGQSSGTVNVALIDDKTAESSETMTLHLTAADDTAIADADGTGTIVDDDSGSGGGGGTGTTGQNMDLQVLADIPAFDRCDFLDNHYCTFPWPNDWFTKADSTSRTGKRINLNILSMPRNTEGKPLDPSEWNRNDGFSPGQAALVMVDGLSAAKTGIVPITHIADSFRADQPVVVIDADTGERQLIWAEIDADITKFTTCDSLKPANAALGLADDAGAQAAAEVASVVKQLYAACKANPPPSDPTISNGPALIIRPAKNYTPGHRYIVALRRLKDASGATITAPAAFQIYRDKAPTNLPMVEARRAHFESLFATLGRAGISRDDLYMAWDFTVISDHNLYERVLHVRDDALAKLGDTTPGDGVVQGHAPTISKITVTDNAGTGSIAREVRGVITVPSYLDKPFGVAGSKFYYAPDVAGGLAGGSTSQLTYGDGLPDVNPFTATQTFDFLCRIPRRAFGNASDPAAATTGVAQRPSLYGHGLLGSKSEGSGQIGDIIQGIGMVYCATDWIGMASHDSFDPGNGQVVDTVYYDPPLGDVANVVTLLNDMSNFASLTDRLQQSFINFMYLGRAIMAPDGFCAQAAFKVGNTCLIDRTALYYDGNSQGGIFGGSLTAIDPDIKAGTLGVPGMNYSTLLQRSVDFDTYAAVLYASYRSSLDQQFVLSMIQMLWDRSDNDGYVHHLRPGNALPNTPEGKRVMLHPAFGDHQVSMWTAEVMARTIGASIHCPAVVSGSDAQRGDKLMPGINAAVSAENKALPALSHNRRHPDDEPYYGIPCINAYPFTGNALVVWDSGPTVHDDGSPRNDNGGSASGVAPPPVNNTPPRPDLGYGGDPHEFPRSTLESRLMKDAFYHPDGAVTDTCGGKPCATRGFKP